jgi:hypothetical protein
MCREGRSDVTAEVVASSRGTLVAAAALDTLRPTQV